MIQGVLDSIVEWLKEILIDCIMNNLTGMFDQINTEIGEVAANVGTTPAAWNAGVFSMIRTLSDNVVVPIAGMILTFVLCYELITMIIDRNNFNSLDIVPGRHSVDCLRIMITRKSNMPIFPKADGKTVSCRNCYNLIPV